MDKQIQVDGGMTTQRQELERLIDERIKKYQTERHRILWAWLDRLRRLILAIAHLIEELSVMFSD